MRRSVSVVLIVSAITIASALASAAAARPKPKISASRARSIAARAIHGRATKAKYEFEDGRWQYGVIVMKGGQMYEVEVDSNTGKVLDTEKTTAAEEAKEEAAEKRGAAPKESNEKGEKGGDRD